MKFPSKITFLAVLLTLLGSTVGAYAFLAPGLTPSIFNPAGTSLTPVQGIPTEMARPVCAAAMPSARPPSVEQEKVFRAQRFFEHSA